MNTLLILSFLCIAAAAYEYVPGGLTEARVPNGEVRKILRRVRDDVESHLELELPFPQFQPVVYKSQVVAGIMYYVKVRVDCGTYIHVKVWDKIHAVTDPSLRYELQDVQTDKTFADELKWF